MNATKQVRAKNKMRKASKVPHDPEKKLNPPKIKVGQKQKMKRKSAETLISNRKLKKEEELRSSSEDDSTSDYDTSPERKRLKPETKERNITPYDSDSNEEDDSHQEEVVSEEEEDGSEEEGEVEQESEEEESEGEEEEEEGSEEEAKEEGAEKKLSFATDSDVPPKKDEFAKLRKELSGMPFDELQSLKEKIGVKLFNQVMFGKGGSSQGRPFKRENKNRPREMSSKVRPRKLRHVVEVKKRMTRDPRFDDLSGDYREDIFKKTYSFLDDIKKNEKDKVKTLLKKERNEEKKEELSYLYKRLAAQEHSEKLREKNKERDQERRREERKLLVEGKTPYFLKNSDKKKLELAEKYRELKRKGKLDQYLSKKRKKNASKEKRKLPTTS